MNIEDVEYEFPIMIYPKEYTAFILYAILFNVFGWSMMYFLLRDGADISITISGLVWFLVALYFLIASICLITKKIYIKITNEYVEVKTTFTCKQINIKDIKYIATERERSKTFERVKIKAFFTNKHHKSDISFFEVWFSEHDIRIMKIILNRLREDINA